MTRQSYDLKHYEVRLQWLKLLALKVGDRGFDPHSGLQVSKKNKMFLPRSLIKIQYCGEPP